MNISLHSLKKILYAIAIPSKLLFSRDVFVEKQFFIYATISQFF